MAHCWTASATALYWAGALLDGARHAQAPEGIPDKVCCETGKMVTRVHTVVMSSTVVRHVKATMLHSAA